MKLSTLVTVQHMIELDSWNLGHALSFCIGNGTLYVASLYMIPADIRRKPRDDPIHMKYRMTAVSISTIASMIGFYFLVPVHNPPLNSSTLVALGFNPCYILESLFITATLMTVFYLGPICTLAHYLCIRYENDVLPSGALRPYAAANAVEPQREPELVSKGNTDTGSGGSTNTTNGAATEITDRYKHKRSIYQYVLADLLPAVFDGIKSTWAEVLEGDWTVVRALVVAPVTEEIVFRAVMAPALYLALVVVTTSSNDASTSFSSGSSGSSGSVNGSPWSVVWSNPCFFGLAHLHHCIEKISQGWPVKRAALMTLVQFTYTSIFGAIATLLFLRTNSVYSAILSHVICNYVGLPDAGFLSAHGSTYSCLYAWRIPHLALHIAGLALFMLLIMPLTQSFAKESIYWREGS